MAELPAVQDVVKDITADIRTIVRAEIELAKAEVVPGAKKAGMGAGMFAAAAVFGIIALNVLFVCLGFLFTNLFWGKTATPIGAFGWGFLCAVGVYLVIAAILAFIGWTLVKKFKTPDAAVAQAQKTQLALTSAVNGGLAEGEAVPITGKKMITTDATGQIVSVFAKPTPSTPARSTASSATSSTVTDASGLGVVDTGATRVDAPDQTRV